MTPTKYVPRTLEKFILSAGKKFPVLLLTGPRQVGKTTLLQRLCGSDRNYVTLDDPIVLSLAKEDPALFFQRFPPPLLIDEIQYAPQLLSSIKMLSDQKRGSGLFWLAGSQQFHLMKGVSESLAGRVGVIHLLGLSRREQLGLGENDVPFLPGTEAFDDTAFLRLLRAAAVRAGQLVNLTEISRVVGVSVNTVKNWLSILGSSGIVYLLEPCFNNSTKRLVKSPKLYFLDTGLCAYLTEWSSPGTLMAGALSGPILETWILAELLKGYLHNGRRAPFYFYRDKEQKVIDLLIVEGGVLHPLEFKKTASPSKAAVKHFSALEKLGMPIGRGAIICLVEQVLPLTGSVDAIPVYLL